MKMQRMSTVALTMLLCSMGSAHAQSAGQWKIGTGWFHVAPQSSGSPLTVTALGQSTTVQGSSSKVANADTYGITATYFLTDNFALETAIAKPPRLRLVGKGTLERLGEVGSAEIVSPSLLLQYHFLDPSAKLRPFVGAGLSYVKLSKVELANSISSGAFLRDPTRGSLLEGPTSASFTSSIAPVVSLGINYNIDEHWSLGLSVSYTRLSTRATLTTRSSVGDVISTTKAKINPIVSFLSVGYRF